jgi:hypothetical protein
MNTKEILKKYGNIQVKFKSYYKYVFILEGLKVNGDVVEIGIGGDPDEIYRLDIEPDTMYKIGDLHTEVTSFTINGTNRLF